MTKRKLEVDPQKFHFSTEVRVRLSETDAIGIVFHSNFFVYMDVARVDYLRNLNLADYNRPIKEFHSVMVNTACDFVSPARFDDLLVVKARISRIGHSSFTFEFLIYNKRENRLVAVGETTQVVLDEGGWKPKPVPEEFRKVIRKYEGSNLEEAS